MATHSRILAAKNSTDRGAWWATVRGVAKSWTGLKRLSTHARGLLCVCTVTCVLLCKELCPRNLVPGPFTCYSGVTPTTGEGPSRVADVNTCTHGAWGQRRLREARRSECPPPLSPQLALPSIHYTEQCRLVRSGVKHFDEHCLPTTVHGEMEGILNRSRMDTFLVYLQCWKVCEAHGLPLTEDILVRGAGGRPRAGGQGQPPEACPSPADEHPATPRGRGGGAGQGEEQPHRARLHLFGALSPRGLFLQVRGAAAAL